MMRISPIIFGFLAAAFCMAADDRSPISPENRIREGNAAFLGDDLDTAERYYLEAAESSTDPGLVAFNRGAVAFAKGQFREAELHYLRALADDAIPAERRARALFNRGVCLLKRSGDANVYRTAIDAFELCAAAEPSDSELSLDARHNLEIAKLLWLKERAKASKPPPPGDEPREPAEPPKQKTETPQPHSENKNTSDPNSTGKATKTESNRDPVPKNFTSQTTPERMPGAGNLPVLLDAETPQPLTSTDTRELLQRIAERLDRERKANTQMLTGPERTHVRDW